MKYFHAVAHRVHGSNGGDDKKQDGNHDDAHEPSKDQKTIEIGRHFI